MKKLWRIVYAVTDCYSVEVEAETKEEAEAIADKMGGEDFTNETRGSGPEWHLLSEETQEIVRQRYGQHLGAP